jgi:hypothetical protein
MSWEGHLRTEVSSLASSMAWEGRLPNGSRGASDLMQNFQGELPSTGVFIKVSEVLGTAPDGWAEPIRLPEIEAPRG